MGDTQRAIAIGRQAAQGTPAATLHWLNFVTDFQHRPNLKKETPKFKINHRWMERKTFSQTRFDEVTIRGQVDSTDIGWLLCSALGPPATASGVHTFLGGSTQIVPITGSNSMLLTVAWMEGLNNLYWRMIDAKVNTMNISIDATGDVTFEATVRGVQALPLTSPPTPSFTPPADNTPFQPWQVVLSDGGTGVCVVSARVGVTNNYDPFYCTPVVAPTAGAEAGLFPKRFTDGEVTGTYDLIYEYTADAGSSFYNFRHDIDEDWVIDMTDPNTGPPTPECQINLPKLAGTSGELDRSKPNVLQSIKGSILYDGTLGSGMSIVLTNGLSAYTAT